MITGFLQGFVDNEINLNRELTCKNTCEDYRVTRQYGCHNDTPCGFSVKNQRISKCKGILRECEYIGSDLEICPSVSYMEIMENVSLPSQTKVNDESIISSVYSITMQSVDMKRYKYLKYENGRHLGDKGGCAQAIETRSWTDWFVRCHNCFCLCDEFDSGSDRYFSLRDVVSDIDANQ